MENDRNHDWVWIEARHSIVINLNNFSSNTDAHEVLENFRQLGEERTDNDLIESRIFDLSKNKFGFLDVQRFIRATRKTGLNLLSDPRLTDTRCNLDSCQNFIIENVDDENINTGIDYNCFKGIIGNNSELLSEAFDGQFVIADFHQFQNEIKNIHQECGQWKTGTCADYTDYLSYGDSIRLVRFRVRTFNSGGS